MLNIVPYMIKSANVLTSDPGEDKVTKEVRLDVEV
jgi:hypothetical protein